MLHTIKKVKYLEGYKLQLTFDDGVVKVIDFEKRLKTAKNMFLDLKEISYFKKVKSDGITLVWPNGLDLCPDTLYTQGKVVKESLKKSTTEKPQTSIAAKAKR